MSVAKALPQEPLTAPRKYALPLRLEDDYLATWLYTYCSFELKELMETEHVVFIVSMLYAYQTLCFSFLKT